MQHRVLRPADVQIYRHPVRLLRPCKRRLRIMRVHVPQVIPAAPRPLRHRIRLPHPRATIRQGHIHPLLGLRQRRLTRPGRLVILHVRQSQRQFALVKPNHLPIRMHQGKRLPPVPLPTEQPVAQLVIDGPLAQPPRFQPLCNPQLELRGRQPSELPRVDRRPLARKTPLHRLRRAHHLHNRQVELLGKLPVPIVMRRHGHDRPRPVADQNVIAYPDRNPLAVHRVNRIRPRRFPRLLLGQISPVQVALPRRFLPIRRNRRLPFLRRNHVNQRMLRGQHHIRRPEQRVRPSREHPNHIVLPLDLEIDLRPYALADPVLLQLLDRLRPVHLIQPRQQPLAVLRNPQHPLAHRLANHRMSPALAQAPHHLLIGQYRPQRRTPVHRRLALIGQPMIVDVFPPRLAGKPLRHRQFLDRPGLLGLLVEPAVEELQKNPLRPLVVVRVGRIHLPIIVIGKPQRLDLPPHVRNVLLRRLARASPGLNRILLRRQPERIPPDRVQHVEPLHPLVSRNDIRRRIPFRMSHMQPLPRRIRKHIQHVVFRLRIVHRAGRIDTHRLPRLERLVRLPVCLPLLLNRVMVVTAFIHSCLPN